MVNLSISNEELFYLKKLLNSELKIIEEFLFVKKTQSFLLENNRKLCLSLIDNVRKKCSIVKKEIKEGKNNEHQ